MILIDRSGIEHRIKDRVENFTLPEYDKLSELLNDEKISDWNRVLEILVLCGLPNDVANQMGFKSLIKAYKALGLQEPAGELKPEIEIAGKRFKVFEDTFELTGGQMGKLESIIKEGQDTSARLMAMIAEDIDTVEPLSFLDRVEFFKEHMTVADAAPYVAHIYLELTESIL